MFIHFDGMYERDRHADKRTDGQTPHYDIGCACIASRGNKIVSLFLNKIKFHINIYSY